MKQIHRYTTIIFGSSMIAAIVAMIFSSVLYFRSMSDLGVMTTTPDKNKVIQFDLNIAEESIQQKTVVYDGDGDAHYDTISAFIKSMRGSDPDATLYWLAKMLYAGEDPRFIVRPVSYTHLTLPTKA